MSAKSISNISLHHEEARLLKALQVLFATEAGRFCTLNEALGRCIKLAAVTQLGQTSAESIANDRSYRPVLPYFKD